MYADPEPSRTSTHTEDVNFIYDDVTDTVVMAPKPKKYARDEADLPQKTLFNVTEMIKSLDADEPEPKLFSRVSWSSDGGAVQAIEKAERDPPKQNSLRSVMAKFKRGPEEPERIPHPVLIPKKIKKVSEPMDLTSITTASEYYTDGSDTDFKARGGVQYRHHSTLSVMDYSVADPNRPYNLKGDNPPAYSLRETGGDVKPALSPANKILGHRITCQSTPIPGGGWEKRRARQEAIYKQWNAEYLAAEAEAEAAREQEALDFWDTSVQRAQSLAELSHLPQPSASQASTISATHVDSADLFATNAAAQPVNSSEEYANQAMAEITPWQFSLSSQADAVASFSKPQTAEGFKERFPPPPIPDTPTRSSGHKLRSVKSDCSIRTTASGRKVAPPIAYPKRAPADVIIITPEKRPDLFIAKAKSSVYHDPVDGALYDTLGKEAIQDTAEKQALKDSIERMKESVLAEYAASMSSIPDKGEYGMAVTAEEKQLDGKELKRIGKKIIARASVFGFTPLLDWSSMTTQEVRAYGYAIEKELKEEKNKVSRIFRHVGKEKAQAEVQRHVYLTRQRKMAEKMLKGKLSEEKRAKLEQAARKHADSRVSQAQFAQQDGDLEGAGEFLGEALKTPELGGVRVSEPPGSKYSEEGKYSDWNSSRDEEKAHGDTNSESQRMYERPCAIGQQTPWRNSNNPLGLGITMSQDHSFVRTPSMRQRSFDVASSPHTPCNKHQAAKELRNPGTRASPTSTYSPLSPFADPPMKFDHSSQTMLNRFGGSTFKVKRDEAFARKLEEQKDKRIKQIFGSHPALRADFTRNSSTVVMGDIWTPDETRPAADASDTALLRPSVPTYSKRSSPQSAGEDEGYATGSIMQHHLFTKMPDSDSDSMSVLEYHGHLSHIHDMMQLRYTQGNHRAEHQDETVEYVDNPDYEASQDSTLVDDGEPSPETRSSLGRPTSILFADIDDAIQQWSPKTNQTDSERDVNENDCVRRDFGLPALKLRDLAALKHPGHNLEWDTEKLMCYEAHLTPTRVRGDPKNGSLGLPLPSNERLIQTIQRCDRCFKMCCLFAESMVTASIPARTADEKRVRMQAEKRASQLQQAYPSGTEAFDTFLTCSYCSSVVCPRGAKICKKRDCCEVMCRKCGIGGKGSCFRHSRV